MTQTLPAEYPARTSLDVAFWLLERGARDRAVPDLVRLQYLLFLAQSDYQARHGQPLMPASFVARAGLPMEPNVDRVLRAGIADPWSPEIDPKALEFLEDAWRRYGALPLGGLQRLVSKSQTPEVAKRAEPPKQPTPPCSNGAVELKPLPPGEDVRFTADGRAVTRWKPRRRVEDLRQS